VVGFICETTCDGRVVSVRTLFSFVWWPYDCASATSSFCASQLGPGESDSPKILEKGDLGINCVQFNLGAIEIESNGVIISSCQSSKRVHPLRGNGGVHKPRRHLPEKVIVSHHQQYRKGGKVDISSYRHARVPLYEENYKRLARKVKPLGTDAQLIVTPTRLE